MDDKMVKRILVGVLVAIPVAYFIFLIATWNNYLKFQAEAKRQVDEKLDEWLSRQKTE